MRVSRRGFLQVGGGAALAAAAGQPAAAAAGQITLAPASTAGPEGEPVRFASVGVGIEGAVLLRACMGLPQAKCVAACDVYDGRHTLAKEIAGQDIAVTRDFRQILADPKIEAVLVATPDHQHAPMVIAALGAGKDVYCEKPMSHTIAEGEAMVRAAGQTAGQGAKRRVVQVGSQRVSSAVFGKARELCQGGAIGPVRQVELMLGRNSPGGAWEYPPPPDLSPANLDWNAWLGSAPKKAFDPLTFARWRCWKEYGTGMAGDLMVHLLSGMQFVTGINQMPDMALSVGGIYRWKDGRNMPDLQVTTFLYGTVPVTVRLTQGTETPEVTRVMGPGGVIEVSNNTVTLTKELGVDGSPAYGLNGFPAAMKAEYLQQWHAAHDAELAGRKTSEVTTWKGTSWDDHAPHLSAFFTAVRTRGPLAEDAMFGHHAAGACHMANASYFEGRAVRWDGKRMLTERA